MINSFAPGPLEMLILGLVCFGPLVAIAVVVVVLAFTKTGRTSGNPNLVPCPDCGRRVSRFAEACPNCGRPLLSP